MRWVSASTAMVAATIFARAQAGTVPLVDIKGDGQTCPQGTDSAEVEASGKCASGDYISDRDASGKCCFHPDQLVFVQSLPGGEDHLNAAYPFDSQACCSASEEEASLEGDTCSYDDQKLAVSADVVTKCCWNPTAKEFTVHLAEFQPQLSLPDLNIQKDGQVSVPICNLGYKATVKNVRVYGDRVELDIAINVDCVRYNHTAETTLAVYLKKEFTASGRLSYSISWIGPTVNVDVSSKVNPDKSISLHGRITGTGVLGKLEDKFDETIKDDTLAGFLEDKTVC